jgi:hypothetical protein
MSLSRAAGSCAFSRSGCIRTSRAMYLRPFCPTGGNPSRARFSAIPVDDWYRLRCAPFWNTSSRHVSSSAISAARVLELGIATAVLGRMQGIERSACLATKAPSPAPSLVDACACVQPLSARIAASSATSGAPRRPRSPTDWHRHQPNTTRRCACYADIGVGGTRLGIAWAQPASRLRTARPCSDTRPRTSPRTIRRRISRH